jgi:ABC-type multidrug transport system fused ATPase/permease subunit
MGPAFRRLLPFVFRYPRQFSLGLLFVLLTTAIQLLPPWVLKHAVDDLTAGVTRGKLATYAGIISNTTSATRSSVGCS